MAKQEKLYLFIGLIVAALSIFLYVSYSNTTKELVREFAIVNDIVEASKPFSGNSFSLEGIFEKPIWGSLNSGHYFGLKLSIPNSPETSMLWYRNQLNEQRRLDFRHLCDQSHELEKYYWFEHDFYNFGKQTIVDGNAKISTSFIINPNNKLEWQATVSLESVTNASDTIISFIQYLSVEKDQLNLISYKNNLPIDYDEHPQRLFSADMASDKLGLFRYNIDYHSERSNFIHGSYLSSRQNKNLMSTSDFIMSNMMSTTFNNSRYFVLPGNRKPRFINFDDQDDPNILAYQLILRAPATFTISLRESSDEIEEDLTDYNQVLADKSKEFNKKFIRKFNLIDNDTHLLAAKVALSNLIGGVGYFYGKSYIKSKENSNRVFPYGPIQLLTAVPSRSFFPRGFLWDEGFHNILISEWDSSISEKILFSWFNIINKNGWMPREVILGVESMRRVPEEFIVQDIANANPPTMFLAIEKMIQANSISNETLHEIYPRLVSWFDWFLATQKGPKPFTYRWRGRDELSVDMLNPKTLTSGLDDYPRASHPSDTEYHVDLRCWMALVARVLTRISMLVDDRKVYKKASKLSLQLHDNKLLDRLHWDSQKGQYCDYGESTEKTELVRMVQKKTLPDGRFDSKVVMKRQTSGPLKFGCVAEFGYVSLFPLLLKIIDPDNPKLGIILQRLSDEQELWSPCGIRSLSKQSRYYNKYNTEHDKPYWRGPIWLNMNYLILDALKHYSSIDGPYRDTCVEIFNKLRKNIIDTVIGQFEKQGYFWESYDDISCKGQGSHPFTGWTSLILLIISSKI